MSEAEAESAINEGPASEEANPQKVLCRFVKGQGCLLVCMFDIESGSFLRNDPKAVGEHRS